MLKIIENGNSFWFETQSLPENRIYQLKMKDFHNKKATHFAAFGLLDNLFIISENTFYWIGKLFDNQSVNLIFAKGLAINCF